MLTLLTEQLGRGQALSEAQVQEAIGLLVNDRVTAEAKAAFLTSLALKGETVEEIAAFARGLRNLALQPPIPAEVRSRCILDVVGTGGDRLNTFNISTTVALVASSAGVTVAKHGNRAVTSKAGSADVLEALGVRTDLAPDETAAWLKDFGFAFFFAPRHHPAFKEIAPARKLCAAKGQRTIFNYLGPLLNPARPSAQLVGVPQPRLCEPMARVLQSLGIRQAMVVCGQAATDSWLDELSILGENTVAEFYQDKAFHTSILQPGQLPIRPATLSDLVGGSAAENAETVRRLLRGDDRGPKRDMVLLNSAAALLVAGACRSLQEGWEQAAGLIDSGRAMAKLQELVHAAGRAAE